MNITHVSETETGVLNATEEVPGCLNPRDKNALSQSKELFTKAELGSLKALSVKTGILHITYYRIITQILKVQALNKKRGPR